MMPTTLACPLDIPEQTLSAWRDGLLDPHESRRIELHVASCAGCQQRSASFEHVAWSLRRQREPDLREDVWRGLLVRLAAQGGARRHSADRSGVGRRFGPATVAAVAALVVVALFAAALATRLGRPSTPGVTSVAPTATSISTVVPTSEPTPATSIIPQGWTAAQIGSGFLPDVAFAPSSPVVGYAVIVGTGGSASVSGTRDSGATWRHLATPVQTGQDRCMVSIDPTDASDVALVCTPPASSGFTILRSTDAGATWTRPQLGITVNCYGNMGWAGGTLLMAFTLCDSGSAQTQLIASVGKGPFKRLDTNGAVSGITLAPEIRLLTGHGSTYFVQMGQISYNPTQLADTLIGSSDAGTTWKTVTLSDSGQRVHLYGVSLDGRQWAAVYESAPAQLALSADDGQTWRKLPPPWTEAMGPEDMLITPDNSVLVRDARADFVQIPDALYVASPGAAQWRSAVVIPTDASQQRNTFPRAVAWDASGHPKSLWARMAGSAQGGQWFLISHPL